MRRSTLVAFAAALAAACGSTPTEPSSSTSIATAELFVGRLPAAGSRFYAFSPNTAGSVSLMLASLTPEGRRAASTDIVGLAFGIPRGTGCSHDRFVETRAGLTAQLLVAQTTAGVHCVDVYDVGRLAGSMNFAVRIVMTPVAGTPPEATTSAGSDSFSTSVPALGSATRTIPASQAGTITVHLTSLSPTDAVIGFGLGIPRADGGGCYLSTSTDATTGAAPLASRVDPGTYCVQVYDSGLLKSPATFTLTTLYP
ncbi:MAG: hypothetical protein A3H97_12710 [Acidobacteria bacterium RIFCSPLOWO2_02_FULL_65_29]|nr:MAG: hypothetical protein A3H97_12710 [Acidobacteria bacterium RIFCSPLOWO2_02_FULL_65_29]